MKKLNESNWKLNNAVIKAMNFTTDQWNYGFRIMI